MTRAIFIIAAVAFLCIGAANSPPVTFESPCQCRDAHGKARLAVKNDRQLRLRLRAQFNMSSLTTSTVGPARTHL